MDHQTIYFEKPCPGNYKIVITAYVRGKHQIEGALLNGWKLEPGSAIVRDLEAMLRQGLERSEQFGYVLRK